MGTTGKLFRWGLPALGLAALAVHDLRETGRAAGPRAPVEQGARTPSREPVAGQHLPPEGAAIRTRPPHSP